MNIHFLGICGTFMGSLAILARSLGHKVSGCDENVYPPMSTLLSEQGIDIQEGYKIDNLPDDTDLIIIGNTISRGNELLEHILNFKLAYTSGPQWLYEHVLRQKHVLAVAGTHGKTTTTSMLAWILEYAGLNPGFLIGGVAENFSVSARLTDSDYFVIEADEYDTAFFDKRSKFIHYHPDTLVINNIEFDHADIFSDIDAIKTQFHHLLKCLSTESKLITHADDKNTLEVINQGCWSSIESFSSAKGLWRLGDHITDFSQFDVIYQEQVSGQVEWKLIGDFNAENALAAIAAAHHVGVQPGLACEALSQFSSVKRRLQKLATVDQVSVYDDFAHHPTAIAKTLAALRAAVSEQRVIVILEPRSNTMKSGVHSEVLASSLEAADRCFLYQSADVQWDITAATHNLGERCSVHDNTQDIIEQAVKFIQPGDHVVIMSNGGFEGIHQKLIDAL